jgi:hypothetical protein
VSLTTCRGVAGWRGSHPGEGDEIFRFLSALLPVSGRRAQEQPVETSHEAEVDPPVPRIIIRSSSYGGRSGKLASSWPGVSVSA